MALRGEDGFVVDGYGERFGVGCFVELWAVNGVDGLRLWGSYDGLSDVGGELD